MEEKKPYHIQIEKNKHRIEMLEQAVASDKQREKNAIGNLKFHSAVLIALIGSLVGFLLFLCMAFLFEKKAFDAAGAAAADFSHLSSVFYIVSVIMAVVVVALCIAKGISHGALGATKDAKAYLRAVREDLREDQAALDALKREQIRLSGEHTRQ